MSFVSLSYMVSICLENKCIRCCCHTNMHLTDEDITQIMSRGYNVAFFVKKHDGWLQLRNKNGRCVFHTGTCCSIYAYRPWGCRLYPIVYDIDIQSAIYDSECPFSLEFPLDTQQRTEIKKLVAVLFKERAFRQASELMQNTKTGKI